MYVAEVVIAKLAEIRAARRYFERPNKGRAHHMGCSWFKKPYETRCDCGTLAPDHDGQATNDQ